jgi:hypothetical protein
MLLLAFLPLALAFNHNSVNDGLTLPEQGPYWEGDIRIPDHFKTAYKNSQWPGARVAYYVDEASGFSL